MEKEKKNLLVFGYGLALIISFFVIRHGMKQDGLSPVSVMFLGVAVILFLITSINYELLRPVYIKWMVGAHFIGTIISGLILSVLFYGVFAPAGIILRLLRKDLLDQSLDSQKISYWIKKELKPFNRERYKQQF